MRNMMWIYATILLLVAETWSVEPAPSGTNQSTPLNSNNTSLPKEYVPKNETFNLGSEVKLKCNNKTWNEMMFVIWDIHLGHKYCKVAFNTDGQEHNNCTGGKKLENTSDSQSYLHIPEFSTDDQGIYKCASVYSGGIEAYQINVSITVPPEVLYRIENCGSKRKVVCIAQRGKPAATISWSDGRNSTFRETVESDGLVTVESELELSSDLKNLSCIIKHQFWEEDRIVEIDLKQSGNFQWIYIPAAVLAFVVLVGFLIFAQKKLVMLRPCCKSRNSSLKPSSSENVEEVEPYASYVQRVNSIYNSSADFFSPKNPAHASHAHI